MWFPRSAVNHSPRPSVGSTGLNTCGGLRLAPPHLQERSVLVGAVSNWKTFNYLIFVKEKRDTFWPRQEFIRNPREERKDEWVCCWTRAFGLCWKFAEVVGWCTAPLGERCGNSWSQCQSFGFACATTASPGRSGPPWGQLEGWRSRRGKAMSGSVIFLNVQARCRHPPIIATYS